MRGREGNRREHDAQPGDICPRQCLQHIAAKKYLFGSGSKQENQDGNEQSFANQPESRGIETEANAAR